MKQLWILILSLLLSSPILAANGMIEGKVTDKDTGEPLPGANIMVVGTTRGAASDIDGNYLIVNVPPGEYSIEANYIGYQKVLAEHIKVEADKTVRLDFSLVPGAMEGETISVTRSASSKQSSGTEKNIALHRGEKEKTISSDPDNFGGYYNYSSKTAESPESKSETGEAGSDKTAGDLPSYYSKIKGVSPVRKTPTPQVSGLRAGFADDNKQYNYFLNFLDKNATAVLHQNLDVGGRIHLLVKDSEGRALPNATVRIMAGEKVVQSGMTYPDGSFNFFPNLTASPLDSFRVKISYGSHSQFFDLDKNGNRQKDIDLAVNKKAAARAPLDILFILDTTGSMGEEIARLRATIDLIHLNLTSMGDEVLVRFGMVLYRDRDDDYLTKTIPLTADVEKFRSRLDSIKAEGGGDAPEDLQAALDVALHDIAWNKEGIRLGFIITDAEAHLDYGQKYTYSDAARDAKKQGIRLHSIGTGGLEIGGEYVLRQISQFTSGRYIFLTYGEEGESEGGSPGSVSHHTGANYQTDKLEAIVIQFAKEDLQHFLDREVQSEADYFLARQIDAEENTQTLGKLFGQALSQLVDYSTIQISDGTILGLLPISSESGEDALNAEYLTEQVSLACKKMSGLKLADRGNLDEVMKEWKLQLSGATLDSATVKIGHLLNAETLLLGNLFPKGQEYELFLKLVRVETGELLAVTRLRIDRRLCPSG